MRTMATAPTPVDEKAAPAPTTATVQDLPYPRCQQPGPYEGYEPGLMPQPRKWQPSVTWAVLILNVLIWTADGLIGLSMGTVGGIPRYSLLLEWGVKSNTLILQGQTWRLLTPIFLHVGLTHLAFNTYAIYVIGPRIECFFGPLRFAAIYLLSGVYGVLFSFALSPEPSAGASAAIFGLIGTQAAFSFLYRDAFGERGRRQLYSTLTVIAFNLVLTFTVSGIDIWGHVGGLAVGAILGWSLTPRYALLKAASGSVLVDRNSPSQWGVTVAGAVIILIVSTWLTITVQATGL
jgi:rhomboid protease GluP